MRTPLYCTLRIVDGIDHNYANRKMVGRLNAFDCAESHRNDCSANIYRIIRLLGRSPIDGDRRLEDVAPVTLRSSKRVPVVRIRYPRVPNDVVFGMREVNRSS